jgi:chromosome segregation ATPase
MYIAFRKTKPEIKVLNSQEQLNLATALRQAAEALSASLTDRSALEGRIDELEAHRVQRHKEIEAQNQQIDAQSKLIDALRAEITAIQMDDQRKISRLILKLEAWERWFEEVEVLLKELGKEVPPRPAELGDSQPKIPAVK